MALNERPETPNEIVELPLREPAAHTLRRVLKYVLVKGATILVTIFIGVFITVLLANRGGQVDATVRQEIDNRIDIEFPGWNYYYASYSVEQKLQIDQQRAELQEQSGLNLPYWPRQVMWTLKALRLDWKADLGYSFPIPPGSLYPSRVVTAMILTDLPHTLLLVGTAFLLLFLIGLPLSLYLFRKQGSRLDHLVTMLAAATPVPSWVFGILLVLLFAVGLRLLPVAGMYDIPSAATLWGRVLSILRHMLLPVLAILLSLLLQCVYTWRTFFLLFAEEDYVELARAKGLSDRKIERSYILRPTLPYILTNFSILLVTFWQMTIALEKIVNWPGIGRLYLLSLPNFSGEQFYPGVMSMTLGVVVLFAYLLGITVFVLDIVYALVDPRVRIGEAGQTMKTRPARPWRTRFTLHRGKGEKWVEPEEGSAGMFGWKTAASQTSAPPQRVKASFSSLAGNIERRSKSFLKSMKTIAGEFARYPSAVFGLVIVLLLVAGSLYAVIAYPYAQLGDAWYSRSLTGIITAPVLAQPAWTNWFRRSPLPPMIVQDSQNGEAAKTITAGSNGLKTISLTYKFDYPYQGFPQDIVLYFEPRYTLKQPFAMLTWITPDGRQFDVGRMGVAGGSSYKFLEGNIVRQILAKYPGWANWFIPSGNYPTPAVELLFASLASTGGPVSVPGVYTLRIDALTFEPGSDLDATLVLVGQVYGAAGTDYMRRDLLVPLLWGMPFALAIGLGGAFITTLLSMVLAATGVWFGGWVDGLIQRLVEANMILPVIGIAVLIYSYFNVSIWALLWIIVLLNVFGSSTKSFRAALLQVRDSPYIEAATAYGAGDGRIIFRYLVPRILPILIPQLVILIPSYVFLEATLGIFNVTSNYPTWGRIIYEALEHGGFYGSSYWVFEPIGLLLLTGVAFAMLGFALERILNPRLMQD